MQKTCKTAALTSSQRRGGQTAVVWTEENAVMCNPGSCRGQKDQKRQRYVEKAEQKEKEKRQRERLRSLELQRDKLHKAAWNSN
ncbi:hypothetical protein TELCIR_03694 [Teladorsagia circumcincta]|uniref:Uncharacterized protein n=1 Tax=Teladorsagia circumcincta TaxID=45464 RepID=A0A2G9UVL8_TELCI|nr:hypothetical protein TELCIR_03694 [Teladorsagia circumcincta]